MSEFSNKLARVGPYLEYTWDFIASLVAETPDIKSGKDFDRVQMRLQISRARQMSRTCVYAVDHFCTFWEHDEAWMKECLKFTGPARALDVGRLHEKR